MASPQKENGYSPVSNELVEAFCSLRLSANEWQILWCVIRYSYGWSKKTARLTYSQIKKLTGINSPNIARALKKLKSKNIIKANKKEYALQKDYEKWEQTTIRKDSKLLSKQIVDYYLNRQQTTIQTDSNSLSKQIVAMPHKPNSDNGLHGAKTILKQSLKQSLSERLFETWKKQFPNIPIPKKIPLQKIDYFLYKTERGEINITKIRNITAYIKSLIVEEFPNLIERENQRIAKLKEETKRKAKERKKMTSINVEENKKIIKEIIASIGKTC